MNRIVQASEDEFLSLIEQAVRKVMSEYQQPKEATGRPAASKKEAAQYLGISESTLNRLLKAGSIQSINIGRTVHIKWAGA